MPIKLTKEHIEESFITLGCHDCLG
jgi:hypothetical protein